MTKPTVLVIEDNTDIRENTVEMLHLSGYDVLTAENGSTGFVSASENHPDVILCDILMPHTDGVGFLKLVKNERNSWNIPVIFFSAGSAPDEVLKVLNEEGYEFLSKPFTFESLIEKVGKCLAWKHTKFHKVSA